MFGVGLATFVTSLVTVVQGREIAVATIFAGLSAVSFAGIFLTDPLLSRSAGGTAGRVGAGGRPTYSTSSSWRIPARSPPTSTRRSRRSPRRSPVLRQRPERGLRRRHAPERPAAAAGAVMPVVIERQPRVRPAARRVREEPEARDHDDHGVTRAMPQLPPSLPAPHGAPARTYVITVEVDEEPKVADGHAVFRRDGEVVATVKKDGLASWSAEQ